MVEIKKIWDEMNLFWPVLWVWHGHPAQALDKPRGEPRPNLDMDHTQLRIRVFAIPQVQESSAQDQGLSFQIQKQLLTFNNETIFTNEKQIINVKY